MGSPFTADLCELLGDKLSADDPVGRVVLGWEGNSVGLVDALALRLVGGLHALVLSGEAPALASMYPEGDKAGDLSDLWPAIVRTFESHTAFLLDFIKSPPQTNEVGRSAVLFAGFQTIVADTGLPLVTLELGASGGANVFWDHYAYELGGVSWGRKDAPVKLAPDWSGPVPALGDLHVASRAACDQNPFDMAVEAERLRLRSYIWPDQLERRHRLEAAIDHLVAAGFKVEAADAGAWAEEKLATLTPGHATVLYHSVFWQYLGDAVKERIRRAIDGAAAQASPEAPFAWLSMELDLEKVCALLRVRLWPSGEERVLAECDPHGKWVSWLDA